MPQTFHAVVTNHEPKLKRPEAASERHMPIAIIDDGSRFGWLVTQILGQDAQGFDQGGAVGDVKAVTIKVGEHPFVGVEGIGIGQLNPLLEMTELGTESSRAAHGSIDM